MWTVNDGVAQKEVEEKRVTKLLTTMKRVLR
jgi:hypothetical protein